NVITGETSGNNDTGTADTLSVDGVLLHWNTESPSGKYTLASGRAPGEYTVMDGAKQVGALTLGEDGAYSFTLDASYNVADGSTTIVVPYPLTDGDGDPPNPTLFITLTGADTPPSVNVTQAAGSFYEAGLDARAGEPAGSGEGDATISRTGV